MSNQSTLSYEVMHAMAFYYNLMVADEKYSKIQKQRQSTYSKLNAFLSQTIPLINQIYNLETDSYTTISSLLPSKLKKPENNSTNSTNLHRVQCQKIRNFYNL